MNDPKIYRSLNLLLLLLVANIGMSGYLIYTKSTTAASTVAAPASSSNISKEAALAVAKGMIESYNSKDLDGLYMQFSDIARLQFSKEKLHESLAKLYPITGKIEEYIYSHTQDQGIQDGKKFETIFYKLRLNGGTLPTGELKLTVAVEGQKLGVYGFYINAQQQP
jgi:hypothetical protein